MVGQPASAATHSGTPARQLAQGAGLQRQLLRLYAAYRHIPIADIARIVPGSAREAQLPRGGARWAALGFQPSARAPVAVATGFQDGAGSGIFTDAAGHGWRLAGLGGEPLGCDAGVPAAVRQIWRLAGCPDAAVTPRILPVSAAVPAAAAAQLAGIAEGQVGMSDDPAETSFNGLDCNPFTALEVSWASDKGCGANSKLGVKDASEFWCADFAKWTWEQGGVTSDLSVLTPAAASFYTWGKDHGESMTRDPTDAQVGDAVVFYPDTTPNGSYADHVGIVTGVNPNGTVNLVNGDFLGSSNISVQADDNVSLGSWSAGIWGASEDWTFVSPQLPAANPEPAAAVDPYGNKYTVWKNASGDLEESVYTASTGSWTGPSAVTVNGRPLGPLGSAPAVAVGPEISGGHAYQYVFWEGTAPTSGLWEAYWNGTWHGPVDLGDGPLGSAPAAGVDGSGYVDVFWENARHDLEETGGNGISWDSPTQVSAGGKAIGPLGSPPSVAVTSGGGQYVFWEGTAPGHDLWEAYWNGAWQGPVDLGDGPLDSPPAVGLDGAGNQYVFWEKSGAGLEEAYFAASAGLWTGPSLITAAGTGTWSFGSAPAVGVGTSGNLSVFWAGPGTDPDLWEADETGGIWTGPVNDGFGPLG